MEENVFTLLNGRSRPLRKEWVATKALRLEVPSFFDQDAKVTKTSELASGLKIFEGNHKAIENGKKVGMLHMFESPFPDHF